MSSDAGLPAFDALLRETVTAKRLSANKINQLSDMSKRLLKHDTHIISILYKTHRSLSPKSVQKVNSLYTFNALATTAKTMVDKGVARKGDPNAELGAGFATGFLNKMEGVLEGLIDDMVDGWVEGQEKVRKVLEIWKKSNTFPSTTLSTLTARLETAIARNPSENGNGSIVVASGSKSDGVASSTKMEKEQMRKVETIKAPPKSDRSTTPDGYPTTPPPQLATLLPPTQATPPPFTALPSVPFTSSAAPSSLNTINLDPALLATLAQLTQQKAMFQTQLPSPLPLPPSIGVTHRASPILPPSSIPIQPSHPLIRPPPSLPPPPPPPPASTASAPTLNAALAKRDEFARKMAGMSGPPLTPTSTPPYPSQGRPTPSFSGPSEAGPSGYQPPPPRPLLPPQPQRFDHSGSPSTDRYGSTPQHRISSQEDSQRTQYYDARSQPSQGTPQSTGQKRPADVMNSAEGEQEEMEMEMDLESSDEDSGLVRQRSSQTGGEGNKRPKIEGVHIAVSSTSAEKLASGGVFQPSLGGIVQDSTTAPPVSSPSASREPTLDTYDVATFNPMSPDSWAALGKAWRNSNQGAEPNPEALMMYLMSKGVGMPGMGGGDGMGSGTGGGVGGSGNMGGGTGGGNQWSGNDGSHEQVRGSWDDGPYADYSSGRGRGRGR